jgi:F-type H+-transporting ATPase subunit delta
MPNVSDQELALAGVYATAMLQLAESLGETDALLEELRDFAGRVEQDADLRGFLSSPVVDAKTRQETLEKIFRGKRSDLFVDAMQVLNRKGRLNLIEAVAEVYYLELEELRGRVEVHVRTATPLTRRLREKLREMAKAQAGREVDLVESVDESLLGGLVVQIGDRKLDASVATRVRRLSTALLDRASREIHSGTSFVDAASS